MYIYNIIYSKNYIHLKSNDRYHFVLEIKPSKCWSLVWDDQPTPVASSKWYPKMFNISKGLNMAING